MSDLIRKVFKFSKNEHESKQLERKKLERITNDFITKIADYEIFKIPNELYLDCFNKLETLLNNYEFENDDRFVTYGRLNFLKKELSERLNDDNLKTPSYEWKGKWDNRLGAFWDLYDYIRGDRYIGPYELPDIKTFREISSANDQYYREGIICKQEKDILLEMISEIKNAIISDEN